MASNRRRVTGTRPMWGVQAMLTLTVVTRGRALSVMSHQTVGDKWAIIAVEARPPTAESAKGIVNDVFDDHGHKFVAEVRGVTKAIARSEAYAREWCRKVRKLPACECGEIR